MKKERKKGSKVVVKSTPPKKKSSLGLILMIVGILVILILIVAILVAVYFLIQPKATERSLEVDANILQATVYNESICMLSLADSINIINIKNLKFVFENSSYIASEFKKDYEIKAIDLGLKNFKAIETVSVEIEYKPIITPTLNGTTPQTNVTPNCTDGIKNGGETGIDCGGSCKPCITAPKPEPSPSPSPSCTAKTCADYTGQCGSFDNDCEGTITCGCEVEFTCWRGEGTNNVCVNDSVIASCTDSDEIDRDIKGNVTLGADVFEDVCDINTNLSEYYCYYNGTGFEARIETFECASGCLDGKCIVPSCTNDAGCTSLSEACGTGKCNLSGECYVDYNLTTDVCRSNVGECDAVETCQGDSVDCPADINETDETACTGGTCQGGVCTASTTCLELSESNSVNYLTKDEWCVIIGAENVTLDCGEYAIFNDGSIDGIYSEYSYTTIINCKIRNSNHGIYLYNSDSNILDNVNLSYNDYGLYLVSSNSNIINNNLFCSNVVSNVSCDSDQTEFLENRCEGTCGSMACNDSCYGFGGGGGAGGGIESINPFAGLWNWLKGLFGF